MPPVGFIISPKGVRVTGIEPADTAAKLARCQELRAQALATPISNEWDEQDMATYLRHLDETEASIREGGKP